MEVEESENYDDELFVALLADLAELSSEITQT